MSLAASVMNRSCSGDSGHPRASPPIFARILKDPFRAFGTSITNIILIIAALTHTQHNLIEHNTMKVI